MNPNSLHKGNIFDKSIRSVSLNENGTYETSDFNLWQEFKKGNETAFATIYKDNVKGLYGYGVKLVSNKSLVKDTIQDLFVELWDAKENLGDVRSIKSYLFKSIRRKLISKAIKNRKRVEDISALEVVHKQMDSTEISLIEKQVFDEKRNKLFSALSKLNKKQREIIHLKFYGNLSYDEISDVMGLNKKGTYNLMAHTIKVLRQHWVGISITFLLIVL
ncbi:RNA polymerase sigma factor, sigma-70 family [Maribacter dokdonensis]|uniref:RNA polymerase sigma factor, sigma-70 family n=1 Tax=Maribacter dokdonensis TaxID=320912 RepID=A0A1H4UWF2_9FLAO|nr:sigma-70 family RNA polymerase sigma factor [Maribacter dokdonensis]SEC73055.1 RNA polymerase sigma factor, sigma-70 family [Maribacter dokdonensis]